MSEDAHGAARPRARGPGALVLFLLVFLSVVGAASLFFGRRSRRTPAAPPQVTSPDETVAAFSGELEGAGGWLSATLAPLHAEPARQAFESSALARRLGLGPGEPWRLRVRWQRRREPGASRPAGDRPERDSPAGIALGAVEVLDSEGAALRSFVPPPAPGNGPARPLETLLAPPAGALHPGAVADWVLWGRTPAGEVRLSGLVPEGDGEFLAATGFEGPFVLRAAWLRRGDLQAPLARLDRARPGKNGPELPSEEPHGESGRDDR